MQNTIFGDDEEKGVVCPKTGFISYATNYYCLNCKKDFKDEVNNAKQAYSLRDHRNIITCIHCNCSSADIDVRALNTDYSTCRGFFIDGNKMKVKYGAIIYKLYRGRIVVLPKMNTLTLNLDTGYSYALPEFINGKKHKGSQGLRNITYSKMDHISPARCYTHSEKCKTNNALCKEAFEVIRQYKMKTLNCYIPTLKEQYSQATDNKNNFDRDSTSVSYLFSLNRFPCNNVYYSQNYYISNGLNKRNLNALTMFRRKFKCDSTNPFKDLLVKDELSLTKGFKKYANKGIYYNYLYYKLSKLKIQPSNIFKIIEALVNSSNRYYSYDNASIATVIGSNYKFLTKLPSYNENSFINKIVKHITDVGHSFSSFMDLADIFNMSGLLCKNIKGYNIDLKNSIKQIHDVMSVDIKKLKLDNVAFKYSEEELAINCKYENLSFTLAKDSYELIEVGSTMSICVGSYAREAADNDCHIVVVRDLNNEPVMCIELNKAYTCVVQAKLSFNRTADANSELLNSLFIWMKHAKVIPDSSDIDRVEANTYLKKNIDLLNNHNKVTNRNIQIEDKTVIERNIEMLAVEAEPIGLLVI